MRIALIVTLGLALVLAPAGLAQMPYPGPYTLARMNCPDATTTITEGINAAGQIVGFCQVGVNQVGLKTWRSFLLNQPSFTEGTFTWVDFPDKDVTAARGVNDRGDIVGAYHNWGEPTRGFLFSHGDFTLIDYPGATATFPKGINLQDDVVGWYNDSAGVTHAFLWSGGSFTTIDPPGTVGAAEAMGINSRGEIGGWYRDAANKTHGFLYRPDSAAAGAQGVFTTIDIHNAASTFVEGGPNPQGDVVGQYNDSGKQHSFVLRATGALITFDGVPDARWSLAWGLNAEGEIVGQFPDPAAGGNQRGWGLLLPRR